MVDGLALSDAIASIEAAGLLVSFSDGALATDIVVSTDPAAGTAVEPGATIALVVQEQGAAHAPTLATTFATPAPVFVGSTPDFGTFHNRNGCVVFDNQADGESYAVAVPAEGGGFVIDDGTGIQIPMHKVTFDDPVVYTVGGFPLPTDGSYKFVQPPGPTCPTKAFEVLETRLGDRQQPVGTALAVVVACSQNTEECPLQIAYNGRIQTS